MPAGTIRVGVTMFVTTDTPSPADLAKLAEERGIEALLFPEHTHLPVGDVRDHPGGATDLPAKYAQTYDPLIAATAAAGASTRLLIGTAICLVNQRDCIVTAKEVATIDQISNGRFVFGVGAGWHRAEMANHGVDPQRRFLSLRERVEAMTAIWGHDVAAYEGQTIRFSALQSWPKPRTLPRPPVLLGGNGPRAPERAMSWADGWMPHTEVGGDDPLLARIAEVRRNVPPAFDVTLAMSPTAPARLDAYRLAGVDRFLFELPSASLDAVEDRLDRVMSSVEALQ
jgi:probable F420-dependent oxidoreductase